MKRVGNLMNQILEYDNLLLAFWGAAKGKADRKNVISFRKFLSRNQHPSYHTQSTLQSLLSGF